jgi:DNA-binding transcriptional LysR family regulator
MARPLIDLKDLKCFIAVYRSGGFSSAAQTLGTVQSNVSNRIAMLERRLGTPLFERGYRRLTPTAAGMELYAAARRLIAAFAELERKANKWRSHPP